MAAYTRTHTSPCWEPTYRRKPPVCWCSFPLSLSAQIERALRNCCCCRAAPIAKPMKRQQPDSQPACACRVASSFVRRQCSIPIAPCPLQDLLFGRRTYRMSADVMSSSKRSSMLPASLFALWPRRKRLLFTVSVKHLKWVFQIYLCRNHNTLVRFTSLMISSTKTILIRCSRPMTV